ncbi:MAG: hypothetical protein V7L21_21590 [Nostoc sp.]|uniref:hypothetical protein n=1 Tax=Nostoc sp. TaxID=1180 RepID=UPI002FF9967C
MDGAKWLMQAIACPTMGICFLAIALLPDGAISSVICHYVRPWRSRRVRNEVQ